MTIRKGEAAIPDMIRTGNIREICPSMVHLQIAVIHAAHVLLAEDKRQAWAGATENLVHLDIGEGSVVIAPGRRIGVEVPNLAIHRIGSNALAVRRGDGVRRTFVDAKLVS